MTEIQIPLATNPYKIYLDEGLLDHFSSYLPSVKDVVIITDAMIPKQYIKRVKSQLDDPLVFTIPSGEASKSFRHYQTILEKMIAQNVPKTATIIALGGGVVGDLSGFIASTYMRGVSFVQIPTTLLSQIDSSVGGKVAINSTSAKNAIGTFYQPTAVFIDPLVLSTLKQRQLHSGVAELIKYGIIKDPIILTTLKNQGLSEHLLSLIEKAVTIKRDLVLQDEFDRDVRHILNYGHTIGHAIEQHSGYAYLHGEGVAMGMAYMAKNTPFYERLIGLLKEYALPYALPYELETLLPYILNDKKRAHSSIDLVHVEHLGQATIVPIKMSQLKSYLEGQT